MRKKHVWFTLSLLLSVIIVQCQFTFGPPTSDSPSVQIYNMVYHHVSNQKNCVLIFNETGQLGCRGTVSQDTNVGILYLIGSLDDVSSLQTFTADYHRRTTRASNEPQTLYFTLLLSQALFFSNTGSYIIRSLQNNTILTDKISGMFLLSNNISTPISYSPDSTTPQRQYGLYPNSNIEWNPTGNALLYEAIPFPIIILSDVDTAFVLSGDSYNKQQQYRFKPLYVAEMQYTMSGFRSKNTSDCLASGACIPIGGNSVWSILRSENKNNEIIVSSARIDSYSMFRGLSSGAAAYQSSVITNLAAALTLAPYAKRGLFVRDLLFTFFDAETWGYSGSQKFLTDILNFTCITNVSNIDVCAMPYTSTMAFKREIDYQDIRYVVEVGQVGLSTNLSLHYDFNFKNSRTTDVVNQFLNNATLLGLNLKVSSQAELPPSSLHSFHSYLNNSQFGAVLFTDYDNEYNNKYYFSHFDTTSNIDVTKVCDAAKLLSNSLYALAANNSGDTISVNCTVINVLVECLTKNYKCSLMRTLFGEVVDGFPSPFPPDHYSDVFRWDQGIQLSPLFINALLGLATQWAPVDSKKGCYTKQECLWNQTCIAGTCLYSRAYFHDAISPGFDYDYSTGAWKLKNCTNVQPLSSQKLSLYAESNWGALATRVYMVANPVTETITVVMGVLVTLIFALSISIGNFTINYVLPKVLKLN